MTKKIALMMNTNALGGAERSMVEQLHELKESFQISVFLPELDYPSEKLVHLISEKLSCELESFNMPRAFYGLSRSDGLWATLVAYLSLISLPLYILNLRKLLKFDLVYANGNKAAIWSILCLTLLRYKGTVVWHFRDYPSFSPAKMWLFETLKKFASFKIAFIANSLSVSEAVTKSFQEKVHVAYNPVSLPAFSRKPRPVKKIGIVAMLAPWKGLHEIVLFTHLYESELKKIGIEEVGIYTSDIYKTAGEHGGYFLELETLRQKFPSTLLGFHFDLRPADIFTQIDVLVHSSLRPEPFGRVILEAFGFGVPVISTALGGAGELIQKNENGFVYDCFDHRSLFESIEVLTQQNEVRERVIRSGLATFQVINESARKSFTDFMGRFS